jgi:hypothetical protein
MKLGKALTTGCARDAYEYGHELDGAATLVEDSVRTPEPAEVTAEAAQPRQVVDAAIR